MYNSFGKRDFSLRDKAIASIEAFCSRPAILAASFIFGFARSNFPKLEMNFSAFFVETGSAMSKGL